ncbi:error-prone DNA polymerase [Arthrobacter silviterrae]|uniref:DNA-directed DNA polymerase n=1 Tax=Arthrobacter silviterrae TaxID=2026658 RepID=A0ABX0DE39_9MICC|nr:DNA polymerase III subunit alpha [Arthrobacter silviterrae]MDQ0276533.1 error-prone DNA polymerase [Arthrobacter silviterrae]NGN85199.1 DNA polymerase III subunit alpha [Arthrobacter silviterrae]
MFIHLHVASAFSAHYGVDWPGTLAAAARDGGADALAITDRDGLYGVPKHIAACRRAGIDAILGVELATLDRDGGVSGRVVVLAHGHNEGAGYAALCRLVSTAHTRSPVGVSREEIAAHLLAGSGPVGTVLLGPLSDVGRRVGERGEGLALLRAWQAVLPDEALRVEVVSHLSEPGQPLSHPHAIRMLRLAGRSGITPVLTNMVRYAEPDGAVTADVLDAARALACLDEVGVQPTAQGWLKPVATMKALAMEIAVLGQFGAGAARALLAQTGALADACRIDPVTDTGWGVPVMPEASIIGITGDPLAELWERAQAGVERRYPGISLASRLAVEERLRAEMGTIAELGFSSYFLTVAEVTRLIREMGIRSAARGSGAGSLVNYALGISQVDPIRHELLFERFLSTERQTLPDVDIDVESARRHEIYHRIFERFGPERVTLMSMQSGYRARGAARDAGMALGMAPGDIDGIAKGLWRFSASEFREALDEKPELRDLAGRVEGNRQLDLLVDITERLDRLPRHISMHPCGVILSSVSLLDRTPVQPSGMGLPMSQYDKHDMDPMGLIKLDVLGVRMQSAMAYAITEIRRTTGKAIDLEAVPLDDGPTFELIRSTQTLGCFQIESPGQRELIGKLQPAVFDDLITDISLFRPGPMQADMVKPFLNRRGGWETVAQLHPDLEPVLRGTYGIVVFHEQLMRILDIFTGCGLAYADVLRRHLSNDDKLPAVETYFRDRSTQRGYTPDAIERVWAVVKGFGSFGFCRAHGAAFAVPTYESAWLKTHYPVQFLAGLWTHDPGMYPKRLLVAEARRLGIPILPLDVNASTDEYVVEPAGEGGLGIRMSLSDVKGIQAKEVERILNQRPFDSLADLKQRARLRVSTIESLALVGALDSLYTGSNHRSRRDLAAWNEATRHSKRGHVIPGQLALPLPAIDAASMASREPEMTPVDVTRAELDILSLDVTHHLMDSHQSLLDKLGVTQAKDLLGLRNGTFVRVAGVRVATQTPPMHGGKRVVFISIDDGTGCIDATFFADAQKDVAPPILFNTRLLLIEGTTRRTGPRGMSLQATNATDLTKISPAQHDR